MHAAFTAGVAVAACAACVAVSARQGRDAGQQSTGLIALTGTGVLSGIVLTDSSTPRPVNRATVRLAAPGGASAIVVGTDDTGRFSIDGLPAGSFTLSATKPGYVASFHGSKHPGRGPGIPVAIGAGQRVDVTLKMLPGAAISGRVTTSSGEPAPGISIAVVDVRRVGGAVSPPLRGTTDDRGIYRVFGLPPGDYLVSALPRLVSTAEGRGVGTSTGVVQVTDADVQWARIASASGIARATPAGSNTPALPGRFVAYAPVFYPGVTDVSAAAPVSVAAGDERSDISLTLRVVPMARIGGTMVDQNGQPVTSASVALYPPRSMQPTPADTLVTSGALVLPRGTISPAGFSIPGVAPGRYTLVARTGGGRRGVAAAPAAAPTLWSITDLTVDGSDQTDLVLRLLPGVRISGRIAFDPSSVAPPDDLSRTDVTLVQTGSSIGTFTTPRAIVDARGNFEFTSVAPGPYTLRTLTNLLPNGARWTLKSAMVEGRDLADGAFELKQGADLAGLTLTFTDRAAEISGRLIDPEGRPVTRYSIVVFTVDRALWLPDARRIKQVQPATDGSFVVGGLPAGPYAIAAVEDAGTGDLADHGFLTQLLTVAYKVTLAEGERKRQDLRVGSREGSALLAQHFAAAVALGWRAVTRTP